MGRESWRHVPLGGRGGHFTEPQGRLIGSRGGEIPIKRSHNPPKDCDHDYEPTFQGGDTYKCSKCGKEIDMTEE